MKVKRLKPKLDKNGRTKDQRIRFEKYHRLRKILPMRIPLPLDGILCAASNAFHLNVFQLEKQIPNYNSDACTYKGKPNYSMRMAVREEWGEEAANLINDLL
jgi:hypothetical protein